MTRVVVPPVDNAEEEQARLELAARLRRIFVPAVDGPLSAAHVARQRALRRELDRLERAGCSAVETLAAVRDFLEAERPR